MAARGIVVFGVSWQDRDWTHGWGFKMSNGLDASWGVSINHKEDGKPMIRFCLGKISIERGLLEERIWGGETEGALGSMVYARKHGEKKDLLPLLDQHLNHHFQGSLKCKFLWETFFSYPSDKPSHSLTQLFVCNSIITFIPECCKNCYSCLSPYCPELL